MISEIAKRLNMKTIIVEIFIAAMLALGTWWYFLYVGYIN